MRCGHSWRVGDLPAMTDGKAIAVLRGLVSSDLAELMALERVSPSAPWSEAQWAATLADAALGENTAAENTTAVLGMWCEEQLVGHAVLFSIGLDAELQAIVIAPQWRQRGLAKRLLDGVIKRAVVWGSEALLLEVRVSNEVAQALYRQAGFVEDGRRRNYYPARDDLGREDALLMSRDLMADIAKQAEPVSHPPA